MSNGDAVDRAVRVDGSSIFLDGDYMGELWNVQADVLRRRIRGICETYRREENERCGEESTRRTGAQSPEGSASADAPGTPALTAGTDGGTPTSEGSQRHGVIEPTLSEAMRQLLEWWDSEGLPSTAPLRGMFVSEIAAAARLERRVEDMGRRLECLESAQRAGTPSTTTTPTGQAPSGESQKSDATPAGQDSPQNTPSAPPVTAELEALIEAFDEERDDRTIQYNEAIALRGLPSGFDGGYRIVFDESFNALIRRVYHLRDAEVDALRAEAEKTRAELATAREEIARLDSGWGETRTLRKALELELTKARETIRSLTSVDWHGIADQRSAEIVRLTAELAKAEEPDGLWRCECCGAAMTNVSSPSWRWVGDGTPEHKCPGNQPQSGYFKARWFGNGEPSRLASNETSGPDHIHRVADMPAQAGEHPGPEGHDVGLPSGAVPGGFECEAWAWLGEHDNLPKLYPASWNACEVWNVGGRAFHVRVTEIHDAE